MVAVHLKVKRYNREVDKKPRWQEYEVDIDILRLASELVVDGIVEPRNVRGELIARFAAASTKDRHFSSRRHGVPPV